MKTEILIGDALTQLQSMSDKSIHMGITSPPYWGLRSYNLHKWVGGDPNCEHEAKPKGRGATTGDWDRGSRSAMPTQDVCYKCGAVKEEVKGGIGLEPTWDEHLSNLLAVFDEVHRVLRDDGIFVVNYGDAYTASGGGHTNDTNPGLSKSKDRGCPPANKLKKRTEAMRSNCKTWDRDEKMEQRFASMDGLAAKNLMMMPSRLAIAMQDTGKWILRSEVVLAKKNCLSGGVMLYAKTQKGQGLHMLRELARLDPETVQLWNGNKWTKVVSWTHTKRPDIKPLEIQLRNGEWIGCTVDHLWPTQRGLLKANELKVGDVLETCELPDAGKKRPKWITKDALWFAGLYLAEGSRSNDVIQLAGHIKEVERWKRICKLCRHYGGTCNLYNYKGNAQHIHIRSKALDAVLKTILAGRTAKDKHFNLNFWNWRNKDLRTVFDGYLEGDGCWREDGNWWTLAFTRNNYLAHDFRCMAARLGARIVLKKTTAKAGSMKYKTYRGWLRFESREHFNNKHLSEIIKIGHSRARNFYDLTVEDEPHLFSLASGVLSHNCMPESVKDRPTSSHEKFFVFAKQQNYFWDYVAVRTQRTPDSIARDYRAFGGEGSKATRPDAPESHKSIAKPERQKHKQEEQHSTANMRNVLHMSTKPFKGAHFATFSPDWIKPFIKAGTSAHGVCDQCGTPYEREVEVEYKGKGSPDDSKRKRMPTKEIQGIRDREKDYQSIVNKGWKQSCSCIGAKPIPATVLDCFGGAGTTGMVANRLGRDAVIVEISEEYAEIARKRIDDDKVGDPNNYQINLLGD